MSNLVLPSLRQPRVLSWGWPVKKTPSFSTIVQTPASRRGEVRVSLAPIPVWDFEVDLTYIYGDLNQTNTGIQQLLDFYSTVQGAADDWLFTDPYDNLATLQQIGFADGVSTQFQIGRSISSLSFEPMQNVIPSLVQVNGSTVLAGPQPSGNQWYSGLENLLFYSQDFSQSAWNKVNTIVDATAVTGPDGISLTANQINQNVAANGFIWQSVLGTANPGKTYTFSVWIKSGTLSGNIILRIKDGNGAFDVGTTTVTPTGTWTRYSVTATFSPVAAPGVNVYIDPANNAGTGTYLAWGAQLEQWTAATSYVVTTNNAPVRPRGLLTFATFPSSGSVNVTFSYYYRCRFLDDELNDLEEFLYQLWECKSLKFRSLLL